LAFLLVFAKEAGRFYFKAEFHCFIYVAQSQPEGFKNLRSIFRLGYINY